MIAFRDNLPVIVLNNGHTVAFQREWLVRALGVAANRAGYPQWWLSGHVAHSVQMWLETLGETTLAVPVAKLTRAVCGALQVIGYAEIGERFEAAAPFARISLVELAQGAGDGYELAFFAALNHRIRSVMELGGTYYEMHGIEHCVKVLRRTRCWNRECSALCDEIVDFARRGAKLQELGGKQELFLYVA